MGEFRGQYTDFLRVGGRTQPKAPRFLSFAEVPDGRGRPDQILSVAPVPVSWWGEGGGGENRAEEEGPAILELGQGQRLDAALAPAHAGRRGRGAFDHVQR